VESERALEAAIYSVVESDRGPNRFLLNLASLTLFDLEANKIGKLIFSLFEIRFHDFSFLKQALKSRGNLIPVHNHNRL